MLRRVAGDLANVPQSGMIAAAKAIKAAADQEGRRVGGPLLGKKRRGLKLRARDDIRSQGGTTTCRIQGVSPAGWVWVTDGTGRHAIRRRKRGPMRKMVVAHPGTTGRGAWLRVVARAEDLAPAIFADLVTEAVYG